MYTLILIVFLNTTMYSIVVPDLADDRVCLRLGKNLSNDIQDNIKKVSTRIRCEPTGYQ